MIEYNQGKTNKVVDVLSKFITDGNQNTTQESNYIRESMSELLDTNEIPEGAFDIKFNIVHQYQRNNYELTAKNICEKYKHSYFVEEGVKPLTL